MDRPRILFVHGSVSNGDSTWSAQRPLADRFELVIPNRRGFPPNPDVDAVDYEDEARWLGQFVTAGTHLVGHSYGGVISLFAAALYADELASLTVIEPPAFGLAPDDPDAVAFSERATELWESGPRDPAEFLRAFITAVTGVTPPPGELPPELLQGARTLMVERYPWQARPPLDEIRAPALVVSGAHSPAFDAVCDVLEERLGGRRAVLPGHRHSPQLLGAPFNDVLTDFVEQIEASRR